MGSHEDDHGVDQQTMSTRLRFSPWWQKGRRKEKDKERGGYVLDLNKCTEFYKELQLVNRIIKFR